MLQMLRTTGWMLGLALWSAGLLALLPTPAHASEATCIARGWQAVHWTQAGAPRQLLWRAPAGAWTRGAVIVLHGGGGQHHQWCAAVPLTAPQQRFSELALAQGFAVFLLNSTDRVTDREGRACGKVWDDEVRARDNLDLPVIGELASARIAALRPPGSHTGVFLTGLSSGGYMAVRAATHFGSLFTAVAPVSSGDPYGWHRQCIAGLTPRTIVTGIGVDNETGHRISQLGACRSTSTAHQQPWDQPATPAKAPVRVFHHEDDSIVDRSCTEKLIDRLATKGYPDLTPFRLRGDGRRSLANHLWLDEYNQALLDFFIAQGQR